MTTTTELLSKIQNSFPREVEQFFKGLLGQAIDSDQYDLVELLAQFLKSLHKPEAFLIEVDSGSPAVEPERPKSMERDWADLICRALVELKAFNHVSSKSQEDIREQVAAILCREDAWLEGEKAWYDLDEPSSRGWKSFVAREVRRLNAAETEAECLSGARKPRVSISNSSTARKQKLFLELSHPANAAYRAIVSENIQTNSSGGWQPATRTFPQGGQDYYEAARNAG